MLSSIRLRNFLHQIFIQCNSYTITKSLLYTSGFIALINKIPLKIPESPSSVYIL